LRARTDPLARLAFYATSLRACGYLPDLQAASLLADPAALMDTRIYSQLADFGFRRSGEYVYRPRCPTCEACIPVRLPVERFRPRRGHRRCWRRNADLKVIPAPAGYRDDHFALYRRYIQDRHPGGGMDSTDPRRYIEFLTASWCTTMFYEFRAGPRLVGVAVVDRLEHGLSAVYTFFDPDEGPRGLGVYAVLWEIQEARRLGLPWLYLGYWIRECPKMSYKSQFRPLQVYADGCWAELGDSEALPVHR
jgi:leucyl-tRNA---protein transferase